LNPEPTISQRFIRGVPLGMGNIGLDYPNSPASDQLVAADVLLRREPDEEEDEEDEEGDDSEDDEDDDQDDGYSE